VIPVMSKTLHKHLETAYWKCKGKQTGWKITYIDADARRKFILELIKDLQRALEDTFG